MHRKMRCNSAMHRATTALWDGFVKLDVRQDVVVGWQVQARLDEVVVFGVAVAQAIVVDQVAAEPAHQAVELLVPGQPREEHVRRGDQVACGVLGAVLEADQVGRGLSRWWWGQTSKDVNDPSFGVIRSTHT